MKRGLEGAKAWGVILVVLALRGGAQGLTITEINYRPPAGGPTLQFVEVYNDTSTIADLSGYYFASGISFVFPEGTLLGGRAYLVVCADLDAVNARYGIANAIGDFQGSLDPEEETVEISDSSGVRQVLVSYRDRGKWPSAPAGTGHTLSLRSPYLDPDDGVNWTASKGLGGTPGAANFASAPGGYEETELIARGTTWRYRKGTAEFSTPIAAWRAVNFDDVGWLQGATGIGYGDNDDATVLADMQNGYLSIACRKTFTLTAAQLAAVQTLVLAINYDDGFVAYLNGTEVARAWLGNPGANTAFNVAAASHEAGAEEDFPVPKNLLLSGTNVLAVQAHNAGVGSTDFSFIPRLVSRKPVAAPSAAPVLNELYARTTGPRWLEIYNPAGEEVDLGGWFLSDDPSQLQKRALPAPTIIPPREFLLLSEADAGLSFGAPELPLFLTLPDGTAVVDAHLFDHPETAVAQGTSDARYPDGAAEWVRARTPTPGAPNDFQVETGLVLNEILYHPFESRAAAGQPFEERPGEYLEIYNRSGGPISLAGFALTKGVDYDFAADQVLESGEYLVVAEDPDWIRATYGITNVVGPWTGGLQNNGESIRLEDPLGNTVDEVRYGDGGDWSELADGNGSSLELIDPYQDNSAGSAWEPSDESAKAPWVQVSYTGNYSQQAESSFHFTPLQDGAFLLDDVQITAGATSYVANGGFETNTTSWTFEGALIHSRRITTEAHSGNACLEVIATSGGDMRTNRLMVTTSPVMGSNSYTVRFWARWLQGGNLILAHGFDNALARPLWLSVPRDLGTPGRENGATARLRQSAGSVNLGPIISGVDQRPVRPGGNQAVTISAAVSDADGVASAQVLYRLNNRAGSFSALPLTDDGSGADLTAGDGLFSATLPGFAVGTKVLFYLEAADTSGAARRYPVDAPEHTLLYQVGNAVGGQLIVYRLALADDSRQELETRKLHSDDPIYGTFTFDDSEIYYNVSLHYHGSPWNRPGSPRMFKLSFPGDRPLHGARKFNISRYGAAQNEATAYYTIGRTGRPDAPTPHGDYRFVRWELFGNDQGVMSHVETVDGAYIDRRYPADNDGLLLRANGKITFRLDDSWGLTRWAAFQWLGADKEAYRWNWDLHTRTLEDEWAPLVALMKVMDVGQTPTGPAFDAAVREIVDVEEWARVLAVRALNDDWDAVGVGNGQNAYIYYAPLEGRWKYLPWDMDHTFDVGRTSSAPIFPSADPGVTRLLGRPEFRRMYLQALQNMLQTTWNSPRLAQVLDPTGAAGVGNGEGIKTFVVNRTPVVQSALGGNIIFRIRTNTGRDMVVSTPTVTLDGDAPLPVKTILLNGDPVAGLAWTTATTWRVIAPVESGVNRLEFTGYDAEGELVGTVAINVTSTFQWAAPVISSLEPSSGQAAGGTEVVITGSEFHEGVKVNFGTTAATTVQFISSTEVRAVTPAGAGTVDVTVSNVDGKSAVKTAAFSYLGPRFVRGDADGDGAVMLNDAVAVLDYLFREGALGCLSAADANDDAALDLSDAVRLLLALFAGGPQLPPPYPDQGSDPTPDGLGCASG